MADLYNNRLYLEDLDHVANLALPWDKLKDKNILISGATGLIGSFLTDVLMTKNAHGLNCGIYALCRNLDKAEKRFYGWKRQNLLRMISHDVSQPLSFDEPEKLEYVLHMASNTHPILYATDPIGTITTNVFGVRNMLEYALARHASRFVFTSSNEIYGENRGDTEFFKEDYCGYVNCNTVRAGYPESKRCGEALCQAYKQQKGLDVVIPRVTRTYGPTMSFDDTKAISQFIQKGIAKENIVLKSKGTQYYSYSYVADAVSGLLYVLFLGENGEAYNIADKASDIMLKDLAEIVATIAGTKVVFEEPDAIEAAGYSRATKARLDGNKMKSLGWTAKYNISGGIKRTIDVLSDEGHKST